MAFQKKAVCSSSITIITFSLLLLLLLLTSPSSSLLLPPSPLNLLYHHGPILAAPLHLHLTFYGDFTASERRTIVSFLESLTDAESAPILSHLVQPRKSVHLPRKSAAMEFSASGSSSSAASLGTGSPSIVKTSTVMVMEDGAPTVAKWWSLTGAYTDSRGNRVSQNVLIERQASDDYSHGKLLSLLDLESLAKSSAKRAAGDGSHASRLHVILTAADVGVEGFCMHACGKHGHTEISDGELGEVVYAWVGNAWLQCPGYCAWPFVRADYGPAHLEPFKAPNGAGVDGMIINLAKVLVGAATNPYGNGYYEGSGTAGADASGVCTGAYGEGAFPGFPGRALEDPVTRASYNVNGLHGSRFLLPYIWNPLTRSCAVQPI